MYLHHLVLLAGGVGISWALLRRVAGVPLRRQVFSAPVVRQGDGAPAGILEAWRLRAGGVSAVETLARVQHPVAGVVVSDIGRSVKVTALTRLP